MPGYYEYLGDSGNGQYVVRLWFDQDRPWEASSDWYINFEIFFSDSEWDSYKNDFVTVISPWYDGTLYYQSGDSNSSTFSGTSSDTYGTYFAEMTCDSDYYHITISGVDDNESWLFSTQDVSDYYLSLDNEQPDDPYDNGSASYLLDDVLGLYEDDAGNEFEVFVTTSWDGGYVLGYGGNYSAGVDHDFYATATVEGPAYYLFESGSDSITLTILDVDVIQLVCNSNSFEGVSKSTIDGTYYRDSSVTYIDP
jgi:hypothetical protein